MISEDYIIKNEIMNDGSLIYLYYSKMFNEFVAYGYSAYSAVLNCFEESVPLKEAYSSNYQMPFVRVNQDQLAMLLKLGVMLNESVPHKFYKIQSFIQFNEIKYSEWAYGLRAIAK